MTYEERELIMSVLKESLFLFSVCLLCCPGVFAASAEETLTSSESSEPIVETASIQPEVSSETISNTAPSVVIEQPKNEAKVSDDTNVKLDKITKLLAGNIAVTASLQKDQMQELLKVFETFQKNGLEMISVNGKTFLVNQEQLAEFTNDKMQYQQQSDVLPEYDSKNPLKFIVSLHESPQLLEFLADASKDKH